jgi:AcrR family transcriptional regulator
VPKPDGVLTPEKILLAAEDVIARHGPSKATVVDVAQALGVSHGSIYRFFPSKVALREAVVAHWLGRVTASQGAFSPKGRADERLGAWFWELHRTRQAQRAQSPELFEAFRSLGAEAPGVIRDYKEQLTTQARQIINQGIEAGELRPTDADRLARMLMVATVRFHNPAFAREWDPETTLADFSFLWAVLATGISSSRSTP